MSGFLIALGIALIVPTAAFNFHWFVGIRPRHWSGWAATGCGTMAVFCITFGNIIS